MVERIWADGWIVVFYVYVVGGVNIKRIFDDKALSLFIMPPSIEELRKRLVGRATDSEEAIDRRVAKAESEIEYAPQFDKIIVNDNLEAALIESEKVIADFIDK